MKNERVNIGDFVNEFVKGDILLVSSTNIDEAIPFLSLMLTLEKRQGCDLDANEAQNEAKRKYNTFMSSIDKRELNNAVFVAYCCGLQQSNVVVKILPSMITYKSIENAFDGDYVLGKKDTQDITSLVAPELINDYAQIESVNDMQSLANNIADICECIIDGKGLVVVQNQGHNLNNFVTLLNKIISNETDGALSLSQFNKMITMAKQYKYVSFRATTRSIMITPFNSYESIKGTALLFANTFVIKKFNDSMLNTVLKNCEVFNRE